jgi:UDP-N-acetylmuramoyl-L-alanyl-D-glutamate--2,6-diaminopimelate ligase
MKLISLAEVSSIVDGQLTGSASADILCTSLVASSSAVLPGGLFVAVRGVSADGHSFVGDAFSKGALGAVVEDPSVLQGRPGIVVSNTRRALSRLASWMYGEPSRDLSCIGVTGTNGKTTANWIIYHVLNQIGGGCQRIGTLGSEIMGRNPEVGALTSPDPISVQRMLDEARRLGAKNSVLETSSHALDQARVEDVQFDVGIFSNLTRDHLDYHKTFERYFEAKRHLFELLAGSPKSTKGAVINADDEYGRRLLADLPALGLNDWSFGSSQRAALQIETIEERADQMVIVLDDTRAAERVSIAAPFIGRHNAENLVAAYGACRALGYLPAAILPAFSRIPQVPGRLERVGDAGPRVFVDYAHTPDALMRALEAVRPTTQGELWVVFGCGGDRDRGKRPEMASIASEYADQVVITSDNPRSESPHAIINDILAGATTPRIVEVDRRTAIEEAISQASPSDTVVIAGKGHEDYQIVGSEKIYFSDQAVAQESLSRRSSLVSETARGYIER